ncbi:MAG: hypothetical protein LBV34_01960 [Nocardiopsaceae bacterium]|jgi:hypothetical protein|nr:hypothetical protein [Nocardiopsaceae bacterium]
MTTPTSGEGAFLHELELDVKEELTIEETSQPLEDGDGQPTAAWAMDPYAPSYDVGLRTLLGAVEAEEDGSGLGRAAAESETPGTETPGTETP